MSRSTLLVLAMSCALTCASYGQATSQQPQPPASPSPAAGSQTAPAPSPMPAPPAPKPEPTLPSTAVVPLTEPVITLKNACKPKPGATTPEGCVSGLTRGQFEEIVAALTPPDRPPMSPDMMRNFATQYSKLLIFADAARELGMENDPKVQQIFKFARNQILTEALNRRITDESAHPTDHQIEEYYKANPKKYTESTLIRLMIPKANGSTDAPKRTDAEEQAYAEEIQKRWVAGEDPEKLQKEATEHGKAPGGSPTINIGPRRPGTLPEAHSPVFDLKAGEISQVFADPAVSYVYKVVSVREVPLSEVKTQISGALSRQMTTDRIDAIQSAVTPVLNDTYFGPEKPPSVNKTVIGPRQGPPGRPGPPMHPPQPPAAPPQAQPNPPAPPQ